MPKIIAGRAKGRRLRSLPGEQTRPSGARLKEALFSMLQSRIPGAVFLDLFAGSGQMGLEAASRGAKEVVLVEPWRPLKPLLHENIERTALADVCTHWAMPAKRAVQKAQKLGLQFDIIYCDPPWKEAKGQMAALCPGLLTLLKTDGVLVLEVEDKDLKGLECKGFEKQRACQYGRAMVVFYRREEEGEGAQEGAEMS